MLDGAIDRAGGIVFGLKDVGNYFVLRVNALEEYVMLFEFVNNKRIVRGESKKKIEPNTWYELKVIVEGVYIKGYVDDELVIDCFSDRDMLGYTGIWSKADSITLFDKLAVQTKGKKTVYNY